MDIKILGTGCASCKTLEKATLIAVEQSGVDAKVEKIEDIMKIIAYGIMKTPGLVINDKVVISGRVPSIKEIQDIIEANK